MPHDEKVGRVGDRSTVDLSGTRAWTTPETFDEFALMCCGKPHLSLLSDPDSFAISQRMGRMGPVSLSELIVGSDMSLGCGEHAHNYRVVVPQAGRTVSVYRGVFLAAGPGAAAVYGPRGFGSTRWSAGTKMLCVRIDVRAVDEAFCDALGRPVKSHIDFAPLMPTASMATRSWIGMPLLFRDQIFRPNSLLNHPLAGLPFADSLVRGFLFAADHSYRRGLMNSDAVAAPRSVRMAVEITRTRLICR